MNYIIVSFKNRNNLYPFINTLKRSGIFASIINTPKNISSSCGLSAKVEYRYYSKIVEILSISSKANLIGVFSVTKHGSFEQIQRLL